MTTIHPHWQSTDGDEVPVRVRGEAKKPHDKHPALSKKPASVSRMPAAVAGIALFAAIGFFWMGGMSNLPSLLGQNSSSVTVTITSDGTNPANVTVAPGMTITWTNNDTIPHVLSSDTLPTQDGKPFLTSAIFPGSTSQFTVPVNAAAGTYAYISKTSQTVSGNIIIAGSPVTGSAQSSVSQAAASSQQSTSGVPPIFMQNSSISSSGFETSSAASEQVSSATAAATTGLPQNPHMVGTASMQTAQVTSAPAYTQTQTHPTSEPSSGPDVMIVIALSVAAVLWISRKALATVA
jgi:plastocyanin